MNEPAEDHTPDASDAPGSRPVWSRPEPDETVDEFTERFLAEMLQAHRLQERSDAARD